MHSGKEARACNRDVVSQVSSPGTPLGHLDFEIGSEVRGMEIKPRSCKTISVNYDTVPSERLPREN